MLESTIETITPQQAERYLYSNNSNRPLSKVHVDGLARAMASNEWQINGEAIKFDVTGNLLDGQHRLQAIIKSGINIKTVVQRGLDVLSFDTLDTGRVRSGADIFALLGTAYPKTLASAVRLLILVQRSASSKGRVNNHDLTVFLQQNPEIHISQDYVIPAMRKIKHAGKVRGSVAVAAHYMFSSIDAESAELFFIEMTDISPTNHFRVLELRMTNDKIQRRTVTSVEEFALLIKTWNAWRKGKTIKQLQWKAKEGFPTAL